MILREKIIFYLHNKVRLMMGIKELLTAEQARAKALCLTLYSDKSINFHRYVVSHTKCDPSVDVCATSCRTKEDKKASLG